MTNQRADAVSKLTERLGYVFKDPRILERALTHSSVAEGVQQPSKRIGDNERLEFLGDRVLGLLVADRLTQDFPEANEGQLSARLHSLVDKAACARVGERLGIGAALRLSPGETKSGGRRKAGVIADAVEAVLAAIYRDGGLTGAKAFFDAAWAEEFSAPPAPALTNPKSALQEWAQSKGNPLPTYSIVERKGSDHAPTFVVEVTVVGYDPVRQSGHSRQEAEKAAAVALLKQEGVI
jgi:ribonuclease-3